MDSKKEAGKSPLNKINKLKNRFHYYRFIREMGKMGLGGISGGNSVELLIGGDDFFDSILYAIKNAVNCINLETYIFRSDFIGWMIADQLIQKARSGVEVNVIYDAVGCLGTSSRIFNEMKDGGVEVLEYHPLFPWRKYWGIGFRDHRKILIIDGEIAFVGGINIGKEYAGPVYGGDDWRDTHVKIKGPAVRDVQFFFMENWYRNGGAVLNSRLHLPDLKKDGERLLMVLCAVSRKKVKPVHESYLSAIKNARDFIFITNAYFIPDARIYRALVKAAERGVRVTLLLPGKSDLLFVKYASRYLYKRYLRKGIRIFEYSENILHAKTAVVDGVWSTIGSSNLDRRSFCKNLEMNVVVVDQVFGKTMEDLFFCDLEKSCEITEDMFVKRSFGNFLLDWICYRFRNFF